MDKLINSYFKYFSYSFSSSESKDRSSAIDEVNEDCS